jgi:hypothetical protein
MNLLSHRAPVRADYVAFIGNSIEVRQRTEEVPWPVQPAVRGVVAEVPLARMALTAASL